MDFPRWFDRKTVLPKPPMKWWWWKKKFCQMAKVKTAFCDLTEKLLVSNRHWTSKSSNHSGSQIHEWIFLNFFFYYISFFSIFCNLSPFHREWLALIQILMIQNDKIRRNDLFCQITKYSIKFLLFNEKKNSIISVFTLVFAI